MSELGPGVQSSIEKFVNQRTIGTKDGNQKTGLSYLIFQKNLYECGNLIPVYAIFRELLRTKRHT